MEACFSQLTLDVIGKSVFNFDFDALTTDSPLIQVGDPGSVVPPPACPNLGFAGAFCRGTHRQVANTPSACKSSADHLNYLA